MNLPLILTCCIIIVYVKHYKRNYIEEVQSKKYL